MTGNSQIQLLHFLHTAVYILFLTAPTLFLSFSSFFTQTLNKATPDQTSSTFCRENWQDFSVFVGFLLLFCLIVCGGLFELSGLQKLITCTCTSSDFFLQFSFKFTQWFMRYSNIKTHPHKPATSEEDCPGWTQCKLGRRPGRVPDHGNIN